MSEPRQIPIFDRGDVRSLPVGYLVLTDAALEEMRAAKRGALDYVLSFITVDGDPIGVDLRWLPTEPGTAEVRMPVSRDVSDQGGLRPVQHLDPITLDIVSDRTEVNEARVDKPVVVEDRAEGRAHLTRVWRAESTYTHLDQLGPNGPDILKARRSYAVALCGHDVQITEGGEQILRPGKASELPMCEFCEGERD